MENMLVALFHFMRFRAKKPGKPQIGEVRTRQRFAWWPKRIQGVKEDKWVWLELYLELWGYTEQQFNTKDGEAIVAFTIPKWVKISERII